MNRIDQQIKQRQAEKEAKEKSRQELYRKRQEASVCKRERERAIPLRAYLFSIYTLHVGFKKEIKYPPK